MFLRSRTALVLAWSLVACASMAAPANSAPGTLSNAQAREAVMATERAFAKSMADRKLEDFAALVAEDTVFFSGPKPLHGKAAVVAFWSRFYTQATAPFSWEPDEVEVLQDGNLAISSGPVYSPEGKLIARFTSIWRRTAANTWEIIFDKGSEVCDCKAR